MKTIIFDFDGTLVDTQAVVIMSFKETVTKAGYPEPTDAECTRILKSVVCVGIKYRIALVLNTYNIFGEKIMLSM